MPKKLHESGPPMDSGYRPKQSLVDAARNSGKDSSRGARNQVRYGDNPVKNIRDSGGADPSRGMKDVGRDLPKKK